MGICDQRVVIVTGAGGGLGAAHARVLASEGAAVLVNDINTEAARAVVDEITAAAALPLSMSLTLRITRAAVRRLLRRSIPSVI